MLIESNNNSINNKEGGQKADSPIGVFDPDDDTNFD